MEKRNQTEYKKILGLIHQLSDKEIERLINDLFTEIRMKKKITNYTLQQMLLEAPTWTDDDYHEYLSARDHINDFRLK